MMYGWKEKELNGEFRFVLLAPFNFGPNTFIEEHKRSLEDSVRSGNL